MFEPLLLSMSVSAAALEAPHLRVDPVFADHMVLQQGKVIPVRGSAPPKEIVTVEFNGQKSIVRADAGGRWLARLAPQRAGTIGALTVTRAGDRIQFKDVAVGEVWLCSGQSNMDLTVKQTSNPDRTRKEAMGQSIRLLKIQRTASATPRSDLRFEVPWGAANEASVADFSAACWHMAVSLRARGIAGPIGLIHAAWGGSTIEDWMSPDALRLAGTPAPALELLRDYSADPRATVARAVDGTDRWAEINDHGSTPPQGWFREDMANAGWARINVPGQWERSGIEALSSFDGVLWLRRTFDLTPEQAAGAATLRLGRIDERDRVWINGETIGSTLGTEIERNYAVRAGLLRPGSNIVTVRVVDEMGSGGFSGPASTIKLETATAGSISLAGSWLYRIGVADRDWKAPPPFLPWAMPRGLAMAWNGMIAPLVDFPLAGIAWYQGESNSARPDRYSRLLEQWRAGWRRQFGDPRLPVVLVQLPGYGRRADRPTDNNWAQLREVQRRIAQSDSKTGLVVTIDLGVSTDIHPAHKDIVGQRMAGAAMRVAYGAPTPVSPSPVSAAREATGIRVRFADAHGGLMTYGASAPTAFEWCTTQKRCQFTGAKVDGDSVVLDAPAEAAFVRYAWQGFPPVNLYGRSDLPVGPFEIEVR